MSMSAEINFLEVPRKQRPKKATGRKTNMGSRSNVLRKIIDSLEKGQYQQMLYWDDKMKNEFIIKFVHMNNPESKNADYLELFKDLDKLSNNYENYLKDEKYDQQCKIRCKSNLRKLVESGALIHRGNTFKEKSIQLRKYKLISDVLSVKSAVSKGGKMTKKSNANGFNGCETVPLETGITYIKGRLKIENLPNEQSHCLCLSNSNPINNYVNIPFGGMSMSTASPIRPALLDTCCTTENRNEDTRNVILHKQTLIVCEHEKQMDKNAMSMEDPAMYSSSTSCSSIEENDKCELMQFCKLLDQKPQDTVEIQNVGANYTVSLNSNFQSDGKIASPDYYNLETMGTQDVATTTQYTASGNKGLQCSNNLSDGLQNEVFRDMDGDKNFEQLVPSSPQNYEGFFNDLFFQIYKDYGPDVDKPLQQDNDPLWSDGISGCLNDNLFEENKCLSENNEDLFSFPSIDSSDAV